MRELLLYDPFIPYCSSKMVITAAAFASNAAAVVYTPGA
jgi:hypothetical protein